MIDRSSILHGALAAGAVALAATAWVWPEGIADVGEVEVIAGKAEALERIEWSDGDSEVAIERIGDGVQVAIIPKAAERQGASSIAGAPPNAPMRRPYPGTDMARGLFGRLVPFRTIRRLAASEADPSAFGLAPAKATLRLRLAGRDHEIQIGSTTYGASSTYVRAPDGQIYLAKTNLFSELQNGGNGLTERSLVILPRDKIARVRVRAGGRERELVQRHRGDRAKAFFADPAEPDARLDQAGNWFDRLMRTRMVDFTETAPDAAPALVVELLGEEAPLGTVKLWAPGDPVAIAAAPGYSAPITISKPLAELLLKDVEAVLNESL